LIFNSILTIKPLFKFSGKKIYPLEVFNIKKSQREDKTMDTKKSMILAVALMVLISFLTASLAEAGWVQGYYRQDGTYVQPHYRTNPDGNPYNNYSFPGNYNANTGRITPGNPNTYLDRYYNPSYPGLNSPSYSPYNYYRR
jgi:hypothetical protein